MLKTVAVCPSCGTKIKLARGGSPSQPAPTAPPSKKSDAESDVIEIENDDEVPMDDGPDEKELLEQVEDDVEDDMKEVLETGVAGEASDQ